MLSEDLTLALTTTSLLLLSELLPFVKTEGNGLIHTIMVILQRIVDSASEKKVIRKDPKVFKD